MTEEEAKTKWCPMLQVSAAAGVMGTVSNRSNAFDDHSNRQGRCIGSACMAWRWDLADFEDRIERYEDAANIGGITDRGPVPECFGYCGLAGKP